MFQVGDSWVTSIICGCLDTDGWQSIAIWTCWTVETILLTTKYLVPNMILATCFCLDVWIGFCKIKQKMPIVLQKNPSLLHQVSKHILPNIAEKHHVFHGVAWKMSLGTPFWGPRVAEPSVPKPIGQGAINGFPEPPAVQKWRKFWPGTGHVPFPSFSKIVGFGLLYFS